MNCRRGDDGVLALGVVQLRRFFQRALLDLDFVMLAAVRTAYVKSGKTHPGSLGLVGLAINSGLDFLAGFWTAK